MTIDQLTHSQSHLWLDTQSNLVYADLCNALYERELKKLAIEGAQQPQGILLKRIASLSYYIKRASERIIDKSPPLDLDSQNASWLHRQPKVCPASKQTPSDIRHFYLKNVKFALVVPIYQCHLGEETITLDTIDGIDPRLNRIHTNENGWFNYDGSPYITPSLTQSHVNDLPTADLATEPTNGLMRPAAQAKLNKTTFDHHRKQLLKPTKVIMSAACTGHKWLNNKPRHARALSLREMLLATNINWQNFAKTQ